MDDEYKNLRKNKSSKLKYIIVVYPAGIGQTGIIIYNVLKKKIINNIILVLSDGEKQIKKIYKAIKTNYKNNTVSYI